MTYELTRIKELCNKKHWTFYRLAQEMNVPPNNIYNLYRRSTTPSVPTLRQVCKAFRITMAEFYAGEDDHAVQDKILQMYQQLSLVNKARVEAYLGLMSHNKS